MFRTTFRLFTFNESKIGSYSNLKVFMPLIGSSLVSISLLAIYQIKIKSKISDIRNTLSQMKAENLTQEKLDNYNDSIMQLIELLGYGLPLIAIFILIIGIVNSSMLYQARRSHQI